MAIKIGTFIFWLLGIAAAVIWRKRLYSLEHRMEGLTEEISHFLQYPKAAAEETLDEGVICNLQNQISKLEAQFLHEKSLQKHREQQISHFVENMAHQMKTAITALQIRLELAQMNLTEDDAMEDLIKSQECLMRLNNEIDRILRSSQLAEGKIRMNHEPIYLVSEIHKVIAQLKALTDKRQVKVSVQGEADLIYHGDIFWLTQAVENIVKNAAEHTRNKGNVWIYAEDHVNTVRIRIEDEGEGIPPEEKRLLFQRFVRGSVTKSGYGIGLSMAKDIVEAHHGTLVAENREDTGARFIITLPVLSGAKAYEYEEQEG